MPRSKRPKPSEGADSSPKIPGGRFQRLGRLVGLTGRLGADLASSGARRLLGDASDPTLRMAERVLATLGDLKGAALKAGQALTLVSDQLPPEARAVVGRLFSQAPALPFADIARVLEAELGAPPSQVFLELEEKPFAAASLGQVHRGRLRTGEAVAVKVQYPGAADALRSDLKNVRGLANALKLGGALLDGSAYAAEIERAFSAELDYRVELENLEAFRGYLARWKDLVVPRAYAALCTQHVLVLERLDGPTLHAYAENAGALAASERFAVAERLVRAVLGPFLFHRAIHGDTHPGNYVVLPDGRLGVLDFGAVKTLSEPFWRATVELLREVLAGRPLDLLAQLRRAGFDIALPEEKAGPLVEEIAELVAQPLLGPYDFGSDWVLGKLMALKRRAPLDLLRIRPPAEAVLFFRAMGGLSYNLRALKASGDFRPFFRSALAEP